MNPIDQFYWFIVIYCTNSLIEHQAKVKENRQQSYKQTQVFNLCYKYVSLYTVLYVIEHIMYACKIHPLTQNVVIIKT
jgi:hypothetical protein